MKRLQYLHHPTDDVEPSCINLFIIPGMILDSKGLAYTKCFENFIVKNWNKISFYLLRSRQLNSYVGLHNESRSRTRDIVEKNFL